MATRDDNQLLLLQTLASQLDTLFDQLQLEGGGWERGEGADTGSGTGSDACTPRPGVVGLLCGDGGRVFAHRDILAARCDFFASALDGGLREAGETSVSLPHLSSRGVHIVARFLHSSRLPPTFSPPVAPSRGATRRTRGVTARTSRPAAGGGPDGAAWVRPGAAADAFVAAHYLGVPSVEESAQEALLRSTHRLRGEPPTGHVLRALHIAHLYGLEGLQGVAERSLLALGPRGLRRELVMACLDDDAGAIAGDTAHSGCRQGESGSRVSLARVEATGPCRFPRWVCPATIHHVLSLDALPLPEATVARLALEWLKGRMTGPTADSEAAADGEVVGGAAGTRLGPGNRTGARALPPEAAAADEADPATRAVMDGVRWCLVPSLARARMLRRARAVPGAEVARLSSRHAELRAEASPTSSERVQVEPPTTPSSRAGGCAPATPLGGSSLAGTPPCCRPRRLPRTSALELLGTDCAAVVVLPPALAAEWWSRGLTVEAWVRPAGRGARTDGGAVVALWHSRGLATAAALVERVASQVPPGGADAGVGSGPGAAGPGAGAGAGVGVGAHGGGGTGDADAGRVRMPRPAHSFALFASGRRSFSSSGFRVYTAREGKERAITGYAVRPRGRVWTHYAATYDGARAAVAVDGRVEAEVEWPAADGLGPDGVSGAEHVLCIGNSGYGDSFEGRVAEVRLWSGARSLPQIQAYHRVLPAASAVHSAMSAHPVADNKARQRVAGGVETASTTSGAGAGAGAGGGVDINSKAQSPLLVGHWVFSSLEPGESKCPDWSGNDNHAYLVGGARVAKLSEVSDGDLPDIVVGPA